MNPFAVNNDDDDGDDDDDDNNNNNINLDHHVLRNPNQE
jgi:hypothetical protein